jgi:ribonucleoside-diphosphate reductase alpha chain
LETGEYTQNLPVEIDDLDRTVTASPVAVTKPKEVKISTAPSQGYGSSTELLEAITGIASDAPLCMTCGVKMRQSGACYVCEGCGSTSGCS